ncbi:MAG: S8 family serine peptidase [Rhodopirellula sp.]|nr:S8 family serine peptidase [Rhodopirellula sp.]
MTHRVFTSLIFVAGLSSVAFSQSGPLQRVSFDPQNSATSQTQGAKLSKLSPELVEIISLKATLIGQDRNGGFVVDVQPEELKGLNGKKNFRTVQHAEPPVEKLDQLIVTYEANNKPSDASLQAVGFELLDASEAGNFLVVRPKSLRENAAERAAGLHAAEILSLHAIPQALNISLNVVMRLPNEPAPRIITARTLQLSVASSSSEPELNMVPGIRRTGADKVQSATDPSQIVVAVIDTGVHYEHDDLRANMWVNKGEIPNNGLDDDYNGVVDDVFGASFINGRVSGDPDDDNGHGTHCAGIIAGVANGRGVIGMAQTKIMALKFLPRSGRGTISDAIRCIDYARRNGANVISISWGRPGDCPKLLDDAIGRAREQGILLIAAAGNHGQNDDVVGNAPSNSRQENVIAVGAVNLDGERSAFSNFGLRTVDIGAPGGTGAPSSSDDIFSTWLSNNYAFLAGTSMSTPHVSGAVALMLGHPDYRNSTFLDVKLALLNNAKKNPQLASFWRGGRELDVRFLARTSQPPVHDPPLSDDPPGDDSPPVDDDRPDTGKGKIHEAQTNEFFYEKSVVIASDATLITRRILLREKATIHLFASTSAAGVSGPQNFSTGFQIGDKLYPQSFRLVTTGGKGEFVNFGTSLATTLEAGTHDVSWWIRLPENGRLAVRGGGSLDAQAFAVGAK